MAFETAEQLLVSLDLPVPFKSSLHGSTLHYNMAPASDVCIERDVQHLVGVPEVQRPIEDVAVAATGPDAFSTPLMRPSFGQSM